MEHKAFVFDHAAFLAECAPLLEQALRSQSSAALIAWIAAHRSALRDPYAGAPLDEGWQALIELGSADEYGDFALTRFYRPQDDIGLGVAWLELDARLAAYGEVARLALLGQPFGPRGHLFDPGKMGAYFQPYQLVVANHELLQRIAQQQPALTALLQPAVAMLTGARVAQRGLYVTF